MKTKLVDSYAKLFNIYNIKNVYNFLYINLIKLVLTLCSAESAVIGPSLENQYPRLFI